MGLRPYVAPDLGQSHHLARQVDSRQGPERRFPEQLWPSIRVPAPADLTDIYMPAAVPSETGNEGRLVRAARTASSLAERLKIGVAVLTGISAGAALLLWWILWWPPGHNLLSLLAAAVTLGLLSGPAAVLGLFYVGLHDLLALPERLTARMAETVEQSTHTARSLATGKSSGTVGRVWGIVKRIWALRSVLSENRALLVRYGALIRFVNPGFLLLVVAATIATGLLVPCALLSLFGVWIL